LANPAERYYRMRRLVKDIENKVGKIKNNRRYVVYTAIINNFDELLDPVIVSSDIDYICFTDNKNLHSKVWEIIYISFKYKTHRRLAKIFKVLPHLFFHNYDLSIWVDASVDIRGDLSDFINNFTIGEKITCFKHARRNCLYSEADVCIIKKYDDIALIKQQVLKYKKNNYPILNGLIWGAILIRDHNDLNIINGMEEWWHEIENHSVRDQISFNYVIWKQNIKLNYLPISMLDNPFFAYVGHKKVNNKIKHKLLYMIFGNDWVRKKYRLIKYIKNYF
jgi:hypothetical protein